MSAGANDSPPGGGRAFRRDGVLVPRQAFYAVACDPRSSCIVEACAGAGKTWMLVSRIVRALLEGTPPHDILAITFTRRAAGEMRERLGEWLAHWAAPATPDDELAQALRDRGLDAAAARQAVPALRGLHGQVLAVGRPVEIRTFHAWFSQLLGAAPLELLEGLGLRRDFALVEDETEHADEVFRRFHAAVARDPARADDYRLLVERHGRRNARGWLETAWSRRIELALADEAGVLESSVEPAVGPAAAAEDGSRLHPAAELCTQCWRDDLGRLAELLGSGRTKTAREVGTKLNQVLADAGNDPAAAPELFESVWDVLFTKDGPRKHLGDDPLLGEVVEGLQALRRTVAQHDAHLEHGWMVRLSRLLLAEYAAFKRQRGLADMSDLERCALALLGDPTLAGWVQERLDLRVRQLLIDEFQDTSPLQWQVLHQWLAAYAGAGGGTSGQRPPGVFIVGDPKQSIYRFRRAEPRVFEAAREFVREGLDGVVLACDHTRRNAPGVLAVLNPVFEAAVAADEYEGFRAHTTEVEDGPQPALLALPGVARPADARAGADADVGPVWRDTLTTPRDEPDAVLREQEAKAVAAAIASWIGTGRIRPGEAFVLSRKRESLRLVAAALQTHRIPCAPVEQTTLMDAPEVCDLVALMDALVSPRQRLSLAQALKSPLFGVEDADLLRLAEAAAAENDDWWGTLMRIGRGTAAAANRRGEGVGAQAGDGDEGVGAKAGDSGEDGGAKAGDSGGSAGAKAGCGSESAGAQAVRTGEDSSAAVEGTAAAGIAATRSPAPAGSASPSPALVRAAILLAGWRDAALHLPPHDLLDRIVAESDAVRRYAAAVPPERRAGALAAIDALLAQALLLEGGRYASPYRFVRDLRRRAVKAALPAAPDAVQLLTIHGAKGLEARAVFLMDTDPEPMPAERLTLLVDWPVEQPSPRRCAFVASETRCPPSLQMLLEREHAARDRETLNALYVALTRAREWLVVSHTQPHRRQRSTGGASWRERLEAHVAPWPEDDGPVAVAATDETGEAFVLRELPVWREDGSSAPAADPDAAGTSTDSRRGRAAARRGVAASRGAATSVLQPKPAAPPRTGGRRHSRLGNDPVSDYPPRSLRPLRSRPGGPAYGAAQSAEAGPRLDGAVRRVLGWATQDGAVREVAALSALAAAAAQEAGVDPDEVLRRAAAMLHAPSCARFFGGPRLRWAADEVTVADEAGEPMRIDRLVCLDAAETPSKQAWWVLAYRLHAASPPTAEERKELLRRRAAVLRLQPDDAVHCAFVIGDGTIERVYAEAVTAALF